MDPDSGSSCFLNMDPDPAVFLYVVPDQVLFNVDPIIKEGNECGSMPIQIHISIFKSTRREVFMSNVAKISGFKYFSAVGKLKKLTNVAVAQR